MKKSLLLPHRFKIIGWCVLVAAILGYVLIAWVKPQLSLNITVLSLTSNFGQKAGFIQHDSLADLLTICLIVSSLMVCFSKEKMEDEFIAGLRLTSLQWSVVVSYGLLVLAIMFIYGFDFVTVLCYNFVTIPFIFIARFHYILYRTKKQASREK